MHRYDPAMSGERRVTAAPSASAPHRVAVLAFEGLAPFELGVVAEVFALPRPEIPGWSYDFAVCAERPGELPAVGGFGLVAPHGLDVLAAADTVVVPGTVDVDGDPSPELLAALVTAHERGARLVSICSGAFTLAATGLLDGRRAATHWRYAELLQRRFPEVDVDAAVLYVDEGDVLTSAGTAAGIDLCLHLVRRDHGAAVANQVARRMVVAPHRDGGQAQFLDAPVPERPDDDPVGRTMAWALEHLGERVAIEDLARRAHLSERQYTRRFRAATGASPADWLLRQRIRASLPLLEGTDTPVEEVAALVGFPTPAAFRRHFGRVMAVPPSRYRTTFRARAA